MLYNCENHPARVGRAPLPLGVTYDHPEHPKTGQKMSESPKKSLVNGRTDEPANFSWTFRIFSFCFPAWSAVSPHMLNNKAHKANDAS